MMGKLQTDSGKMNVSGQVYEEPLSFECRAHISRHGPSDISESPNDTLAIQHQQQPVNSKKKPQTLMPVRKTACLKDLKNSYRLNILFLCLFK